MVHIHKYQSKSKIDGVEMSKSVISYYRRKGTRVKKMDLSAIEPWEWDWLIGFYYSDGCKFVENRVHYGKRYTIQFGSNACTEDKITQRVEKLLHRLGLRVRNTVEERNRRIIRTYSKRLFEALPKKDTNYIPNNELAFLAGLMDGDGSVKKQWVFMQAKYPQLMDDVREICERRGLSYSFREHNREGRRTEFYIGFPKKTVEELSQSSFAKYLAKMDGPGGTRTPDHHLS